MGWTVIGGVLCPGLESLPRLRVAGTPRDQPAAVECPLMLPTDICASWLTHILFSGGYVGPQSPVAAEPWLSELLLERAARRQRAAERARQRP